MQPCRAALGIEARHGFAGARRALGGMGGHFGAPHLDSVADADRVERAGA